MDIECECASRGMWYCYLCKKFFFPKSEEHTFKECNDCKGIVCMKVDHQCGSGDVEKLRVKFDEQLRVTKSDSLHLQFRNKCSI